MVNKKKVEKAILDLLKALGEDINREGLVETPKRVAKMYDELLSGMNSDPYEHLKFFEEKSCNSDIIIVNNIPVYSICEHHLLPFVGKASVLYISKKGKIIGLSKIARIVDCFSKRLQVQERLTTQIAEFIYEKAEVEGVIVKIEAEHLCMTMRGIKATDSKTITITSYGLLKDDLQKRNEALCMLERGF